jgi:putative mycofactocin binding protein MftB
MSFISEKTYGLSPGTQIRKEDFGLLFYTMKGPRLYFLPSKDFLDPSFFSGACSLGQAMQQNGLTLKTAETLLKKFKKSLTMLEDKGVIHEC